MNQLLMSVLAQRKRASEPVTGENCVRFVSAEARTITPKYTNEGITLQYSVNKGETWTTIASKSETTSATEHWFRGQATGTKRLFRTTFSESWAFSGSSDLEVYGNLNFLLCDTLGDTEAPTSLGKYAYARMFYGCSSLTKAPELPATTLGDYCYYSMFQGCTSLTTAPELPATTLADYCYNNMFYGCTSLTTAPELPATTLASGCYYRMFQGCTSLTTAPELPATTLTNECYSSMFWNCASLTTTPALPATTLADYCYSYMFLNCTSLTTAPELPATTLATSAYASMFQGCTSFKVSETNTGSYTYAWRIPTSGTGTEATSWNKNMLTNTSGTFTSDPTINTTYYVVNKPGGVGEVDEYYNYAKDYYTTTNNSTLFENAWQDMQDSETVLFDIPLALVATNQDMGWDFNFDLYVDVGTDGQLQALYDACVNETIPQPVNNYTCDVYYVNNVATFYGGGGDVGFPFLIYMFGDIWDGSLFFIGDLTPLGMGLGLALAKIANVSIPNNNIIIQQGFEFENESGIIISDSVTSIGDGAFTGWTTNNQPLVIPNSVTSIGSYAFYSWSANNQPLVIPNSVTSIGSYAFYSWSSNNQPLVIPNSVTSIGDSAFSSWEANNQPLVIPDSVTSIGYGAFRNWTSNNQPLVIPNSVTSIDEYAFLNWSLVPYVELQAITPPTLVTIYTFGGQNNAPIYVPDESVDAYKTATNWVDLADRIFPISDK